MSANGDTDMVSFRYGLDDPDCTLGPVAANAAGGTATVLTTPKAGGVRTLYAVGVDAAGNWGAAGCRPIYQFVTTAGATPVSLFTLDEAQGSTAADSVQAGRSATLAGGATWEVGRNNGILPGGVVPPAPVQGALSLNGSTAYAATSEPVVDTSKAFSVSAWVRLTSKAANSTILTQAGSRNSGFQLYYSSSFDRWIFNRHDRDVDGPGIVRAIGVKAPTLQTWTHLVGVYDPGDQQIRLYVNGRLEGWASFTTPWNATGGLQFGRVKYNGSYSENFAGQIDDVRIWQRVVAEPAPVPEAYFRMDEENGIPVADAIYAGRTLTSPLPSGVTQVDDCKFGRCLSLNGSTGYATTPSAVVRTDQAFSVGAWVKLSNKDANFTVLTQAGSNNSGFQLYYSKGYDRWVFNRHATDTTNPQIIRAISSAPPAKNAQGEFVWTHLLGVYDPVAQQIRLYVNGKLEASTSFTTPWHASGALQVGRVFYNGAFSENFAGRIDEVKVWDYAINFDPYRAEEAPQEMENPADPAGKSEIWHLANRPLQLMAHWKLDEAPGTTTAADASPYGRAATLTGGADFGIGNWDNGLVLDGVDDQAATSARKVVQTDRSFSVTAWVFVGDNPESWPAGKGGMSALSQDGAVNSGFQLHARKLTEGCAEGETACFRWTFTTGTDDTISVSAVRANALDLVNQGEWVHLAGVYDMTDRQLRLYVGGRLVRTAQVPFTTAWSAEDVLRIGTARWRNAYGLDFFNGVIDEIHVYTGVLTESDVWWAMDGLYPADTVT